VSPTQDQAKVIAERVARRIKGSDTSASSPSSASIKSQNGSPMRDELAAIREGLHDLENKVDRIESRISQSPGGASSGATRARVIDFVSPGPPVVATAKVSKPEPSVSAASTRSIQTTSPWLAGLSGQYQTRSQSAEGQPPSTPVNPQVAAHPSEERFGVEEAAISELVDFFESEKKCSLDPSGKPCDHCAMCSSRGF
jgi:hypothetical protein